MNSHPSPIVNITTVISNSLNHGNRFMAQENRKVRLTTTASAQLGQGSSILCRAVTRKSREMETRPQSIITSHRNEYNELMVAARAITDGRELWQYPKLAAAVNEILSRWYILQLASNSTSRIRWQEQLSSYIAFSSLVLIGNKEKQSIHHTHT